MYELDDFGSFMIPGRVVHVSGQAKKTVKRNKDMTVEIDPNGTYHIENTYVEYFIPAQTKETVVFVHGGGLCGNMWHTTPDGRKGWLQFFLEQQFAVYIVDTVERGRAGWCPLPGVWEGEPELRTAETTWEAFRIGDRTHFHDKVPFVNQQFPTAYFDQLACSHVPRWNGNAPASAEGLATLIEAISGPCFVIGHSQGCDIVMRALEKQPKKITKIILIEPASFYPIKPLTGDPIQLMILFGDYIDKSPLWSSMRELSLTYQETLSQCGIVVDFLQLPEMNIHGNSHALMMDKNNAVIAAILIAWLRGTPRS